MAFVVVYDAYVLYPAPLRDLLVRVALTERADTGGVLQIDSYPAESLAPTLDLTRGSRE